MSEKNEHFISEPSMHTVYGDPESCWDVINKYGTYNIQPTADSDNFYPAIAHGMPRVKKKKR